MQPQFANTFAKGALSKSLKSVQWKLWAAKSKVQDEKKFDPSVRFLSEEFSEIYRRVQTKILGSFLLLKKFENFNGELPFLMPRNFKRSLRGLKFGLSNQGANHMHNS